MKPTTVHEELASVPGEKIKHIANSLSELSAMGRCVTDEQVEQRIDDYFRFCAEKSMRPGVEGMALSLGVDRTTLYRWKKGNGCSQEREHIIQRAMQYIYAFVESLGLSGGINPAAFIWISKNWMSYKDSGFSEAIPEENNSRRMDVKEMAERLGIDPEIDDLGEEFDYE